MTRTASARSAAVSSDRAIGGQSLCLFLTLLLVPVAYVKFDALEQSLGSGRLKIWAAKFSAATIGRFRPAPAE